MAVLTAEFNPAGVNSGDQITILDAGDLTAWDAVVAAAQQTYSNTHTLFGKALAAKCTYAAQAGFLSWTTAYGATTESYGRCYLYFTALPEAQMIWAQNVLAGAGFLMMTAGGQIGWCDTAFGNQSLIATALATGQWYRVEWHLLKNGTSTVTLYASPHSITPTDSATTALVTQTWSAFALGCTDNNHTLTYWAEALVEKGTAAIGPYPFSTTAPTVSGSATVGSLLTCDGGTWNNGGTFTLTYQWTRDGVNIAAATASTYTTQAADIGHAIGCTVTATGIQATNESASQASANTISVVSASDTTMMMMRRRVRTTTGSRP